LADWSKELIPGQAGIRWKQLPLSISYVSARLGAQVDFADAERRKAWSPYLEALAQGEEPQHPSGLPGEPQIPSAILNTKHWAACSYTGAAHLLADQFASSAQPEQQTFDPFRLYHASTRYFLAFAAALAQRMTLERLHNEGVRLTQDYEKLDRPARLGHDNDNRTHAAREQLDRRRRKLRDETLAFALRGHIADVSYRDAMNRFYDMAQKAQRVKATLELVRLTIRDLDIAHQNTIQTESQLAVQATQQNVEYIEVFVIGVSAIELGRALGELRRMPEPYLAWAVPILGVVAVAVAIIFLGLYRTSKFWRGTGVAIATLIAFTGLAEFFGHPAARVTPTAEIREQFKRECPAACLAEHPAAAQLVSEASRLESSGAWEGAEMFWSAARERLAQDRRANARSAPAGKK
jgi:uncharacterized membrane protein YecN with MAPEG domain